MYILLNKFSWTLCYFKHVWLPQHTKVPDKVNATRRLSFLDIFYCTLLKRTVRVQYSPMILFPIWVTYSPTKQRVLFLGLANAIIDMIVINGMVQKQQIFIPSSQSLEHGNILTLCIACPNTNNQHLGHIYTWSQTLHVLNT